MRQIARLICLFVCVSCNARLQTGSHAGDDGPNKPATDEQPLDEKTLDKGGEEDPAGDDGSETLEEKPPPEGTVESQTPQVDPPAIPKIESLSGPADGAYTSGQDLVFVVAFDQAVTVTGTPNLNLTFDSGAVSVPYSSGSGTTSLTFLYTLQSSDADADGIELSGSITLNGGTIKSDEEADADPQLPASDFSGVTVDPPLTQHRIFFTAGGFTGDFDGDLANADAACQAAADGAALGGTWKAVLASETESGPDRVSIHGPVYNLKGGTPDLIANDATEFWTKGGIQNPIGYDENGVAFAAGTHFTNYMWLGMDDGGASNTGKTCSDWTDGTNGSTASVGGVNVTGSWLDPSIALAGCNNGGFIHLVCIDQ